MFIYTYTVNDSQRMQLYKKPYPCSGGGERRPSQRSAITTASLCYSIVVIALCCLSNVVESKSAFVMVPGEPTPRVTVSDQVAIPSSSSTQSDKESLPLIVPNHPTALPHNDNGSARPPPTPSPTEIDQKISQYRDHFYHRNRPHIINNNNRSRRRHAESLQHNDRSQNPLKYVQLPPL